MNNINPHKKCYFCCQALEEGFYHATCSKKIFGTAVMPDIDLAYDDLINMKKTYLPQRVALPGVQKKLSVALSVSTNNTGQQRLTIVGFLNGLYILKPACHEYPFIPEVEHFSMRSAHLLGITTAIHTLLPLNAGDNAYLCKRFDRHAGKKIAIEDCCQLSGKWSDDKYRGSYEGLAKVIKKYSSNPGDDCLKYFEQIVHSFIIGNADMHFKNFSLITDKADYIHLSPAYDLLSTVLLIKNDREELALSLNGKKCNIRYKDWLVFGEKIGLNKKVILRTLEQYTEQQSIIETCCQQSFMPENYQAHFLEILHRRIQRLLG